MLRVELRPHPEIERYLAPRAEEAVFGLHVCAARPRERSLAAVREGRVVGAVVQGRPFGLPYVQSPWLYTDDRDVTRALVGALAAEGRLLGLQLAAAGAAEIIEEIPGFCVSRDLYLRRPPGPAPRVERPGTMVRLDDARVSSAQMHPEIRRAVGDPRDLGPEPPAWGWWVEGQIVALADTMVRWGQVASVQQVFTAPDLRRQGHSAALISAMMASPAVQGLTLTWLASAANTPSIRLAERLGFVDPQEQAFVEEWDR